MKVSCFETVRYAAPQPPASEWPMSPGLVAKLERFGTKVLPHIRNI